MLVDRTTTVFSLIRANLRAIVICVLLVIGIEAANILVDIPLQQRNRGIFSTATLGLLGTAFSIFLVFRLNEAYSRWWEARNLWGGIVNFSRGFARQSTALIGLNADQESARMSAEWKRELVYRHVAYVNALRMSLRRQEDWSELRPFLEASELEALERTVNKPTQLLQTQGQRLADARRSGLLDPFGHLMLEASLTEMCNLQGGCERIKNTVFPDRVAFFTRLVAWSLAVLIPVCIFENDERIDFIDMLVVPLIMLVFLVTERLGAELKNPFENLPNDTPMTALCRTIEIDLREQLGETQLPDPVRPRNGVLM